MTTFPSWLETLIKACLTVGALAYLVIVVEWGKIVEAVQTAEWLWVAAAALLVPANVVLDAWVWGVVLRPVAGRRLSTGRLLRAVMSGFALGFFTPARVGEYAGRTFHLDLAGAANTGAPEAPREGMVDGRADGWTVSATIFAQRMADMAVAVDVGTVTVALTLALGFLPTSWPWLGALTVGVGVGATLTLLMTRPGWIDAVVRRFFPSAENLHRRTAFLSRLTPALLGKMVAGTTARYGVFTLQLALLAWAFAPHTPGGLLALAVGCTYFAAFLVPPVTLMDLGIREGAAVFFFGLFGLGEAAGLNASFLIFVLNIVLPSALGTVYVPGIKLPSPTKPAHAQGET